VCVCVRFLRVMYMCVCVEHIELPAKLLDYFLRSNQSNINQSTLFVCNVNVFCVILYSWVVCARTIMQLLAVQI